MKHICKNDYEQGKGGGGEPLIKDNHLNMIFWGKILLKIKYFVKQNHNKNYKT
jgi:hypothetical protein